VRQHDDRGRVVGTHSLEGLVRPAHDQLVCARDPLRCCELCTRVDHGRSPPQLLRRGAERLGRVDRADDDEVQRGLEDVGENPAARVLQHRAPTRAKEIVDLGCELRRGARFLAFDREPRVAEALSLDDGEEHRASLVLDHASQLIHELPVGLVDEEDPGDGSAPDGVTLHAAGVGRGPEKSVAADSGRA
jgi:hypothetical protein